jgi:expansin (peptidoglycan-binding protein)
VVIVVVSTGKSVTVTIVDDCPTCDNSNSIDLSQAAFQALADLSVGQLEIKWQFVG